MVYVTSLVWTRSKVFQYFKDEANKRAIERETSKPIADATRTTKDFDSGKRNLQCLLPFGATITLTAFPFETVDEFIAKSKQLFFRRRFPWASQEYIFYKRTVDGKDIPLTGTTILENFSIEDQSNLIAGTLVVLLAEPAKAQLDEKAHTDLVDKLFRAVCSDPEGNVETSTVNEWLLYESCFQAVQLKSRMVKLQLALVQMLGVVEMCNRENFGILFREWSDSELRFVISNSGRRHLRVIKYSIGMHIHASLNSSYSLI
jgi:hypothetical protein